MDCLARAAVQSAANFSRKKSDRLLAGCRKNHFRAENMRIPKKIENDFFRKSPFLHQPASRKLACSLPTQSLPAWKGDHPLPFKQEPRCEPVLRVFGLHHRSSSSPISRRASTAFSLMNSIPSSSLRASFLSRGTASLISCGNLAPILPIA